MTRTTTHPLLDQLGLTDHPRIVTDIRGDESPERDGIVRSDSPASGQPIAGVRLDDADSYDQTTRRAVESFKRWRAVPAPRRGQVVREIGQAFRDNLEALGSLEALEMGKIKAEGIGEVQETIDIADFAVGQSRQLFGKTMPSERPLHA